MGNTNEASKADLNKGIIGVFRLCHFDRMLLHGCRLLSSVPCGVPHFMGALYRFKSAKSTAKTAKFRSRFLPHFRQQHQSLSNVLYRASDSKRRGDHWSPALPVPAAADRLPLIASRAAKRGVGVNDMPVAYQSRAPECPQAFGRAQRGLRGLRLSIFLCTLLTLVGADDSVRPLLRFCTVPCRGRCPHRPKAPSIKRGLSRHEPCLRENLCPNSPLFVEGAFAATK